MKSLIIGCAILINFVQPLTAQPTLPPLFKAAITTNSWRLDINDSLLVDGRDHDSAQGIVPGRGLLGVMCQGAFFSSRGSPIGGTRSGIDYAPASPPDTNVIVSKHIYPGGFPTSPDQLLGGESNGFPEGTLLATARSGRGGSQYATTATQLLFPLRGVTYIDLPSSAILSNAMFYGSGILVVHSPLTNSQLTNVYASFDGVVICDNILNIIYGHINGVLVTPGLLPQLGDRNKARIEYSEKIVMKALLAAKPLILSPSPLPGGLPGLPYSATLTASGGTPPYHFSSGATVPGLSLSDAGEISGSPTGPGNFTIPVTVVDSVGHQGTQDYRIPIFAGSIRGHAFRDENMNAIFDPGEETVPNFRLHIAGEFHGDAVTLSDGSYTLDSLHEGTYLIMEEPRRTWAETYPRLYWSPGRYWSRQQHEAILFQHFYDIAADAYAYRLSTAAKSYIGYSIPPSLAGDGYGSYSIDSANEISLSLRAVSTLGYGTLTAKVNAYGKVGNVSDAQYYVGGTWLVKIDSSHQSLEAKDFGNKAIILSGRAYSSLADTSYPLPGRAIHIRGPIDTILTTASDGGYTLRDILPGAYTIEEEIPTGWLEVVPPSVSSGNDTLETTTTAILIHLNRVLDDASAYYERPSSLGGGGTSYLGYHIPDSLSTDSLAVYSVSPPSSSGGLAIRASLTGDPGIIILEEDSTGIPHILTFYGSSPARTPRGGYGFYVGSQLNTTYGNIQSWNLPFPTSRLDFISSPAAEIHGRVFVDRNGDGVMSANEPPSPGVKIFLGGTRIDSTVTDANGRYAFVDLPAGTFSVCQQLAPGWGQISPTISTPWTGRDSSLNTFGRILHRGFLIAGDAIRYRLLEIAEGGGGRSFIGYTIPLNLFGTPEEYCVPDRPTFSTVPLSGVWRFRDSLMAIADTLARLNALRFTGSFALLGARIVQTDSSAGIIENVDFGVTELASAPVLITTIPSHRANENHPVVSGSAQPGSAVTLFAGRCDSTILGSALADTSGAFRVPIDVADNSTTVIVAKASNPLGPSGCSNPVLYIEDSRPPGVPDSLSLSATGGARVLHWRPPADTDVMRFRVYADTVPQPLLVADSVAYPATSCVLNLAFGDRVYHVRVQAVDSCLNAGSLSEEISNLTTVSCSVADGWNLVSLPLLITDTRTQSLFPDAVSGAFMYEAGYQPAPALVPGIGYWIKMPFSELQSFTGIRRDADSVQVRKGWNLVGATAGTIEVKGIFSEPPNLTTSSFYTYEGGPGYVVDSLLRPGKGYWVRLSEPGMLILSPLSIHNGKSIRVAPTPEVPPSPPFDPKGPAKIPGEFRLYDNYPNPFNPSTTISYDLPARAFVHLAIFDIYGRNVRDLVDCPQEAGQYSVQFVAVDLSSGVYFYRLSAGGFTAVMKMVLVR